MCLQIRSGELPLAFGRSQLSLESKTRIYQLPVRRSESELVPSTAVHYLEPNFE
jgi:hypothetical protein